MTRKIALTLLLAAAVIALAAAAGAAEIEGRVILGDSAKDQQGARDVVVYFVPDEASPVEVPEEPYEIVTVRKQYTPRVLAVPVGSTVRFPNQDNILHNVFSVSGKNRFDLGLYRRGSGKEKTFDHPGVVRVFCNVHHSMVAYVVVVDTPHTTRPAADGRFRLAELPGGGGTLHVWHEQSEPWRQTLAAPAAGIEVRLELTKPRVPKHTNKYGKPYERRRRGRGY